MGRRAPEPHAGRADADPAAEWCLRARSGCGRSEQLPGACDIGLAAGAGEQAVMTDAVEALRQNVEQEAANELVRAERHGALAGRRHRDDILVAERDTVVSNATSRWFEMATRWVYRDK